MLNYVQEVMGDSFNPSRFVPYVMMHEFEALLFSDCQELAQVIGRPELADQFQEIRDDFNSPEEINDSRETAPSKCILALINNYEKVPVGTRTVEKIGLSRIRSACSHFDCWLKQLERLPSLFTP